MSAVERESRRRVHDRDSLGLPFHEGNDDEPPVPAQTDYSSFNSDTFHLLRVESANDAGGRLGAPGEESGPGIGSKRAALGGNGLRGSLPKIRARELGLCLYVVDSLLARATGGIVSSNGRPFCSRMSPLLLCRGHFSPPPPFLPPSLPDTGHMLDLAAVARKLHERASDPLRRCVFSSFNFDLCWFLKEYSFLWSKKGVENVPCVVLHGHRKYVVCRARSCRCSCSCCCSCRCSYCCCCCRCSYCCCCCCCCCSCCCCCC